MTQYNPYDYRRAGEHGCGFSWDQLDKNSAHWTVEQYKDALRNPIARAAFQRDADAIASCEACVGVMPSGRSSHLETGICVQRGIPIFILLARECPPSWDLMYSYENITLVTDIEELLAAMRDRVPDGARIYVASSWKNPRHDAVVGRLRGMAPEQIAAMQDEADNRRRERWREEAAELAARGIFFEPGTSYDG
jgi:hypothetical protein